MNRGTRTAIDDLICHMIIMLGFVYLTIHVVYAFAREDSGFRNPEQFFYQNQQQLIYNNSAEYERLFDEASLIMTEKDSKR